MVNAAAPLRLFASGECLFSIYAAQLFKQTDALRSFQHSFSSSLFLSG